MRENKNLICEQISVQEVLSQIHEITYLILHTKHKVCDKTIVYLFLQ